MRGYEVDLAPEPEPGEAAAVIAAATELAADERLGEPAAYRSAWRRAAAREAVDQQLTP